jgi:hypothetical protein
MASLTPPEITQIISEVLLEIVASLGMTDRARVCVVYEEAKVVVDRLFLKLIHSSSSSNDGHFSTAEADQHSVCS